MGRFLALVGIHLLTTLGITAGFYRLFVHRSFETYTSVEVAPAGLGAMAARGPLRTRVGIHRTSASSSK